MGEFLAAMLAYLVALALVLAFGHLDGDQPARYAWALLPVLPASAVVWAGWRHWRRTDEFVRQVLLRGLAVGFVAAMLTSVATGWLALARVTGRAAPWVVFGVGMTGWLVGTVVSAARGTAR